MATVNSTMTADQVIDVPAGLTPAALYNCIDEVRGWPAAIGGRSSEHPHP